MNKKHRLLRVVGILFLLLASIAPLVVDYTAQAQIRVPDVSDSVNSVEVYRHALGETDSQVLISLTNIKYTTNPVIPSSSAYIARLMNGAVELGSTTPYAYFQNLGYNLGLVALEFDAASAPVWGGAYTMRLDGNPTLDWMDNTATTAMDGAIADDGGVLTDETAGANDAVPNDMTLMPVAPAVDDAYYFGSDGMFNILTITVSTNGAWTGTYAYEYWNGTDWVAVTGLTDGTTGFTAGAGTFNITYTAPTNWQKTVVNGLNQYWLRFRIVSFTAIVTQPLGQQSWTNTSAAPPTANFPPPLTWIDEGSVAAAQSRLTIRLRAIAQQIEDAWKLVVPATDLIQDTATGKKLTSEGEAYFTNVIPNLRSMCPDLFSGVITTPDFTEKALVPDFYMGGDNSQRDVENLNWFSQTFTTVVGYRINGVWIKAYRVGNPGTLTVGLRGTGVGLPNGPPNLLTGTIDANTFTTDTNGAWYQITFTTDAELANATTYAIVISSAGVAPNIAEWRIDTTGDFIGGQACVSAAGGGGGTWVAIAGQDFMFGITATDAYSMSYRNRLSMRLVGTRFDMTNLGLSFGLTRMWMSTLVWFVLCGIITIAVARTAESYKVASLALVTLMPIGALAGFIYLEVGVLGAMFFSLAAVWIFWRSSP